MKTYIIKYEGTGPYRFIKHQTDIKADNEEQARTEFKRFYPLARIKSIKEL